MTMNLQIALRLSQYPISDTIPVPPPAVTSRRRAMLVADDAATHLQFARPLAAAGYECEPVSSAELLDALARGEVEVAVVDMDAVAADEAGLWRGLVAAPSVVRVLVTRERDLGRVSARVRPGAADAVLPSTAVDTQLASVVASAAQARVEDDEQVSPAEARRLARAMVRTLSLRGYESEAHCLRLAVWARALGKAMGLSRARLLDVELGAMLHDIGQLAMPDEVLGSSTTLTPEQWKELRRHPDLGAELLRGFPALRRAISVVQCHHERRDGGGYPRGLRGAAIPLDARIFQVVDAYDALTSDRPHRPARSDEEAREEIRRNVGTQFDPEVFDAFSAIPADEWLALVQDVR